MHPINENDTSQAAPTRPMATHCAPGLVPESDEGPFCERCGAPLTTALMAAICPYRERCEFWPDDEASQEFLDGLGMRYVPRR